MEKEMRKGLGGRIDSGSGCANSASWQPIPHTTPWIRVLLLCSLWLIPAGRPALAQLGTATISGNVTDSTGAVLVGATVTAVNNATGFRRQTISNELGQYNLPGLSPGSYSLTR